MSLKGKINFDSPAKLDDLLTSAKTTLASSPGLVDTAGSTQMIPGSLIKAPADFEKGCYLHISKKKGTASFAVPLVGVEGERAMDVVASQTKRVDVARPTGKEKAEEKGKTTGKRWFDMPAPIMTPTLQREVNMLKLRVALDPKRHYKKQNAKAPPPKHFQVGTIIEGPTEFYSARLTRKERKETLVEQLLADEGKQEYFKRKYLEIKTKKESGKKAFMRKKKDARAGKGGRRS